MDGGTENETVSFIGFLPELIYLVFKDTFFQLFAFETANATPEWLCANPTDFRLKAFLRKNFLHFLQGAICASVLVRASVYKHNFHDDLSFYPARRKAPTVRHGEQGAP